MSTIDIEQYAHSGGIKALRVLVSSPAHKRALSIVEGARVHEHDVSFAPDPFLIRRIHRILQGEVTLTDRAKLWYTTERESRYSIITLGSQEDTQLDSPHADALWPFQRVGVAWLATRRCAILGDEMGLGKSVMALLAAQQRKARSILVVTMAMAKKQWQEEMRKWLDIEAVVVDGTPEERTSLINTQPDYMIIHYDVLRDSVDTPAKKKNGRVIEERKPARYPQLLKRFYDVVILDESQKLQNADARQSIAARKLVRRASAQFQLTGTPMWNMPDSLWHLLHLLDSHRFSSYWTFVMRYCRIEYSPYGIKVVDLNEDRVEELQQVMASYLLRRVKSEVRADLPPKHFITLHYDLSAEQKRVYSSIESDLYLPTKPPKYYTNVAATLTDLRFLCSAPQLLGFSFASPKDALLLETLERLFAEKDRKVTVFCWHKRYVDYLKTLLEKHRYRVLTATGNDKGTARQDIVRDQFKKGDAQVLIGTIASIGTALNMEFSDTAIFAEHDWTPANNAQAEDRLHRMTTTHQVTIYRLVASTGIEQHILDVFYKKADLSSEVLAIRAVLDEMKNSRAKGLTKEKS